MLNQKEIEMTAETEDSKKVSNEVLLVDIHNTEKEVEAYGKLSEGFFELSLLPETDYGKRQSYRVQSTEYKDLLKECSIFLNKLYELRSERSLE